MPDRDKQMGGSLTIEEQYASLSDLGYLIWTARISRPGALYGASVSAKNL